MYNTDVSVTLALIGFITLIVMVGLFAIHLFDSLLWSYHTAVIPVSELKHNRYYWITLLDGEEHLVHCFISAGMTYIEFYPTAFTQPRVLELEELTEELGEFQLRRAYVGCKLQRV